ncbi:unnamed protein product, partial [Meganyctiphanes norvegica]
TVDRQICFYKKSCPKQVPHSSSKTTTTKYNMARFMMQLMVVAFVSSLCMAQYGGHGCPPKHCPPANCPKPYCPSQTCPPKHCPPANCPKPYCPPQNCPPKHCPPCNPPAYTPYHGGK